MESGFEADPVFIIISMPDDNEKEQDGKELSAGTTEGHISVGDSADSDGGDHDCHRDSSN